MPFDKHTQNAEILSDALKNQAQKNHREMTERETLYRQFGYDSSTSIAYFLSKILPLNGIILEIGSGKGRFLSALANNAQKVISIDVDNKIQHVAYLTTLFAKVNHRVCFEIQNAQQLRWQANSFNAVVTMNAMHHIPQPDRALAEMVRVLKPGGKLAVCDFSASGFLLMDRIHKAEGNNHQYPNRRFPHWQALLRQSGFRTKTFCEHHQEILVGQKPGY
jgi:ubiquinone/menaquinone biosynthesis C-methylase UbiE